MTQHAGETVGRLAELAGGRADGDVGKTVRRVSLVETAGPEDVIFAAGDRAVAEALASDAGCIVLDETSDARGRTVIRTRDPRLAFVRIAAQLHPTPRPAAGIHPAAVVDPSARVGSGVSIGACAVVEANVTIGEGTVIGASCFLGEGAGVGPDCRLYARVTLYPGVRLGARVILHSGVVLGADGFGYAFNGRSYEKFPQIGGLQIGDDVELGANTTIDRGALGDTVVGNGVKIDNLVQVGHNVSLGDHTVIASQTGISGSTVVESYVVMAGQVGLGDHVHIEQGAVLGGQCGVLPHKTVKKRQTVWGTPARPIREYLANLAMLSRLTKKSK